MRRFIAVCTLAAAAAAATSYASRADAAPLKCPSNDVVAGPIAVTDTVMTTDPVQKGHLHAPTAAPFTPSTCAAPKAAPAVVEPTSDFHYKAHTFKNRSNTAACVDVRFVFTNPGLGTGLHETTAYLGSFDPNDVAKNFLGDHDTNDGGPGVNAFSITVPAMADFVLVTSWTGPATPGYEPHYDLYVAGCGQMVLTGVAPNAGPVAGGQLVTVTGSGFEGTVPALTIGSPATAVAVVDDSTITATTAAHAAGVVDVSATAGAATATLAAAYTYGAAPTDAGADADAATDGGLEAGSDASTGAPTQGGPTQGSSSSGGTATDDAGTADSGAGDTDDDDGDDDAATSADGGAKRVSGTKKKGSSGDEEYVCACNEVGGGATPGIGAFATMALGAIFVLRLRKRR